MEVFNDFDNSNFIVMWRKKPAWKRVKNMRLILRGFTTKEQRNQVLVRDGYVIKWDFQKWINAAKACVYVVEANPGAKSRQTGGMPHTQS